MTTSVKSPAIVVLAGIVVGALTLLIPQVFSQEQVKIPPKSEYQYKKDYEEYNQIMKEADPAKREARLQEFVKAHPESRMIPTVANTIIYPYAQKQDWQKVISLAQDFQKLIPDDPVLRQTLITAYYRSGNVAKAGEMADELYKAHPTKEAAAEVAELFLRMKNTDKYLFYAEKVVAEFPIEQSYPAALQIAQVYIQKQNIPVAIQYLNKVMTAYSDKVPQGVKEEDWNKTRAFAYGVMGADAYAKKDCARTAEYYGKVVTYLPKNADAYYYTGMCKWKDGDQAGAIPYFAKASVLNDRISPKAKEYLDQLYKAEHNGSLDGLDQVLAKAKAELGVS
jgi:tetratricopeptide (TPR) repeat protein